MGEAGRKEGRSKEGREEDGKEYGKEQSYKGICVYLQLFGIFKYIFGDTFSAL